PASIACAVTAPHARNDGRRMRSPSALGLPSVAVEQVAEPAQDRALLSPAAASLGRGGVDAARQAREWQGLEPHLAGAAQRGEEQTFAAEDRALESADELD